MTTVFRQHLSDLLLDQCIQLRFMLGKPLQRRQYQGSIRIATGLGGQHPGMAFANHLHHKPEYVVTKNQFEISGQQLFFPPDPATNAKPPILALRCQVEIILKGRLWMLITVSFEKLEAAPIGHTDKLAQHHPPLHCRQAAIKSGVKGMLSMLREKKRHRTLPLIPHPSGAHGCGMVTFAALSSDPLHLQRNLLEQFTVDPIIRGFG